MMKKRYYRIAAVLAVAVLLLAGCSAEGESGGSGKALYSEPDKEILTITGSKEKHSYSFAQLEKLGLETFSYSGRNKENNNARQIREYTGILLEVLLKDAGYRTEGAAVIIRCSDGYSRAYELDSLKNLYFFEDEKDEKGEKVAPMLAVIGEGEPMGNAKTYHEKDGSPLRFVFGQADYDSEYAKEFNIQVWASYVEEIEVSEDHE